MSFSEIYMPKAGWRIAEARSRKLLRRARLAASTSMAYLKVKRPNDCRGAQTAACNPIFFVIKCELIRVFAVWFLKEGYFYGD